MKNLKDVTLLIILFTAISISGCSIHSGDNNNVITKESSNNLKTNSDKSVDDNISNESYANDNLNKATENNSSDEDNGDGKNITSTVENKIPTNTENNSTEEKTTEIKEEYLLPEGFVYVKDIIPNIVEEMRYSTENNFTGKIVDGYYDNKAILTTSSCEALKKVQNELSSQGLGIKIFDAYRPQKAVDCFVSWSNDYSDTLMKDEYYPEVAKKDIIPSGYIARKSSHSKGSTVDLTIINLETKEQLDMGSPFDFFGVESHFYYEGLTSSQLQNREILKSTMEKYGFKYYKNEWWHYTFIEQPYPNTYFDFDVK